MGVSEVSVLGRLNLNPLPRDAHDAQDRSIDSEVRHSLTAIMLCSFFSNPPITF